MSTSAEHRSLGDQVSSVSLPTDIACFVHIYQSDHNIDLLDFFMIYFQIPFPMGVLSGQDFYFFHSSVNLNKILGSDSNRQFSLKKLLWYEYKSNITRPRKLKTLFFMWMSKNLSAIFSLNVYSVYGSQHKEKKEVIKIFLDLNYKWKRCSRNHLCITQSLVLAHCASGLAAGFLNKICKLEK